MEENEKLAMKLIKSETEKEVVKHLKQAGYWDDYDQWKNYGGIENNFSIIGNQQSNPESALVEKLINSVDAVLIGECLKRGIHPESGEAPSSIKQAVNDFFHVYGGSLSNIDSGQRNMLSEYISLVATGYKTRPTYSIIDRGEGQYPQDFPETFLSLAKSNKIKIPFVQGKFNMGGSGVLQFCGKKNMQLIVSKKNPEISQGSNWGITIVRRQEPPKGYKSSAYTYLAPEGKILEFEADSIPVMPTEYPSAYGDDLEYGTLIKLFEYNTTTGLKSNIKFDLYNKLNQLLPELAMPIRMYERRNGYKGKTMESTLNGLKVRLNEDRNNNIEDGYPSSFTFGDFKAELYVFRPDSHKTYIDNEGILFSVNGQTQGSLDNRFFNRKKVGMGSLADSILVIVSCDNIDPTDREDLFMNSRDRLRYGEMRRYVESELEEYIGSHEGLKELRKERRNERIKKDIQEQKPFQEAMQEIISNDETLSSLFLGEKQIDNPFKQLKSKEKEEFQGKKFPTFLDLNLKGTKQAHIGQRFRIQYTTDAENDYLTRENESGEYYLYYNNKKLDVSVNLWNGFMTVNVTLPDDVEEGDTISLRSELWDNTRFEPFEHEFEVHVKEKRKKREKDEEDKGERKPPISDEGKGEHAPFKGKSGLPSIIEVKKDQWYQYDFGKEDCLEIINNGELGYDFAINMDNKYLLSHLIKDDEIEMTKLKYKYVVSIIGMALLQSEKEQEAREITKLLSPVILPITNLNLNQMA